MDVEKWLDCRACLQRLEMMVWSSWTCPGTVGLRLLGCSGAIDLSVCLSHFNVEPAVVDSKNYRLSIGLNLCEMVSSLEEWREKPKFNVRMLLAYADSLQPYSSICVSFKWHR